MVLDLAACIAEGTVKSRIHHARAHVRGSLMRGST
ncbi:hypothetical protein CLV70_12275 [Pseudosporangium ferrugineum]|uniref:Uncharacterized protein n=1 Tax=Pseudosporangium ferrugineum TaxID=439699 RepID=A0A2T0RHZ0_9ACTN|nr:hypothetical protein CLV70_12275 [Pseudosporangium ferrugineum]